MMSIMVFFRYLLGKHVLLVCIVGVLSFLIYKNFTYCSFHPVAQSCVAVQGRFPKILLLGTSCGCGGASVYVQSLYHLLRKHGYEVMVLTDQYDAFAATCAQQNIDYYTCSCWPSISYNKKLYSPGLYLAIKKLCREQSIDIVHCNDAREVYMAHCATAGLPTKIVLTRHISTLLPENLLAYLDGVVAVHPRVAQQVEVFCQRHQCTRPQATFIPPFFDEQPFVGRQSYDGEQRHAMFKKMFGLDLPADAIVVTMIANFYRDVTTKKHDLFFVACKNLIEQGYPLHALLAGDGPGRAACEQQVKQLGLTRSIHFLGNVADTATLLTGTDIQVLASGSSEAFGIVLLEGALMRKPLITAHGGGAAGTLIIDQKTGLLFEDGSSTSLAEKLRFFLDHPDVAHQLGKQACSLVQQEFVPTVSFKKLMLFYQEILSKKVVHENSYATTSI